MIKAEIFVPFTGAFLNRIFHGLTYRNNNNNNNNNDNNNNDNNEEEEEKRLI